MGEVHARSYLLAVDGEDNVAGTHIGFFRGERSSCHSLCHFDAITLVVRVEERTQICCRHGRSGTAVATAGMGSVEFAQNLAQQNREVIVVGDMGEEFTVVVAVVFPVHAVKVLVIELVGHLTQHVFVDVFALQRRTAVVWRLEFYIFDVTFGEVNLLHAGSGDDEYVLALGIGDNASRHPLDEQLGVAVAEVSLEKIGSPLGGSRDIIQFVPFWREKVVAEERR